MAGLFSILALLIGLNVLFVLMEYALVRVRASRVEMLARRGSPRALAVQEILAHLDRYLAAIQVGITVVALALGAFAEPTISQWLAGKLAAPLAGLPPKVVKGLSLAAALGLLAYLQIVVGELVPRGIAIQKAETIALWGARPIKIFALMFRPPIAVMAASSTALLRLMGLKPAAESEHAVSEEELRIMLGETQEKSGFPLERLLLLENLFDLGLAKVSDAMVARDRIATLSLKKSWDENLETIRARRFSRYPLLEDDQDSIIGLVHVKDLLLRPDIGLPPDLKRARRDIAEVREDEPLEKLLKLFPDKGIHMALVRNSLGQVVGMLTLEDIVEELIGEVQDEFDLQRAWSLMDLIVPGAVLVGMHAADRREAIAQLVGALCAAQPELKESEVFQAVWERELKLSSGVGRGVAVPHGRLANLSRPMVALCRFAKPVPFPSPDATPVRLVFLILTPAGTPMVQLKVLGRIASLVTNENLRRRLVRAKTSETLVETLRTADTLLAA